MFKRYLVVSFVLHVLLVIFILRFVLKSKDTRPKFDKVKPLIANIITPDTKVGPKTNIPPSAAPLVKPQPDRQLPPAPEAKKSTPSEAKRAASAQPPSSSQKQAEATKLAKPKVYSQDKATAKQQQVTPHGLEELASKTPMSPSAPPAATPIQPPASKTNVEPSDRSKESTAAEPSQPQRPAPPSVGDLFDSDIVQKHAMASLKKDEGTRHGASTKEKKDNSLILDVDDMRYAMYMKRVKQNIESVWEYPQSASRRGVYGDLYITFTINKNGTLGPVEVVRTSGHKELDEAAVRSIKDAAPFWPLPDEWGKDSYTIRGHFVYNMYRF
ncbi:MAG: TonB family protein [Nitrospirae bacterium]|nr:TonB family protein [Nitrospirota bacterium]